MENIKKTIKGKNFELSNILYEGEGLHYLTYTDEDGKEKTILLQLGFDYKLINI